MGDGTFDERLGAHTRRRVDGVQPLLVLAEAGPERAAREEADVTADGGEARVACEGRPLRGEPVTVHPVVGVDAGDERAATMREAAVQRRDDPLVWGAHHDETRVARREPARDRERVVARAVVDDDALPVGVALTRDRGERRRERRRCIESRQENGDQISGPRCAPAECGR
jgi:hypothetical protein